MNTRIHILGSLLLLTACDFDPKDIGDPSGDPLESSSQASEASTTGAVTDGPNSTSQGGSETSNGTSQTSTTGVDPTGNSTTDADPTDTSTTGGPTGDPSTSTGTSNSTGSESTSMGETGTSTTTGAPETTTTGGEMTTTTSTGGEEPGPVACGDFPPTFPLFDKQCVSKADCAVVAHTIDCCGSEKLIGIHEGAVGEFNEAEALCDSQMPQCDCLPNPPVAEDGNSILDANEVSLACNAGKCETFLF